MTATGSHIDFGFAARSTTLQGESFLRASKSLRNNIVPFIIEDDIKMFYYRGLKEWQNERGYLRDTCLSAQDRFKKYLDYFRVPYDK